MFDVDEFSLGNRFGGLDPVISRRAGGALHTSKLLSVTFEFVQMPHWRPSFWIGRQVMPDDRFALDLTIEVERDEPPRLGHEVIIISTRRLQLQATTNALPLIRSALKEIGADQIVNCDDVVLTSIRLTNATLVKPVYDLGFQVRSDPDRVFIVSHESIRPTGVRIDTPHDPRLLQVQ